MFAIYNIYRCSTTPSILMGAVSSRHCSRHGDRTRLPGGWVLSSMHIPTGWATTTASPPRAHQRSPVRHAPLPCPYRVVKTMRRACQQLSHLAGSPAVPVQMVNAGGCAVPVYGSAFPDQQSCGAHSFHSSCHVPAPSMFQQEQQLLPQHLHHQQQQPSFSGGFSGPLPPLGHGAPVMGFPPPAFHDPSLHVPDISSNL